MLWTLKQRCWHWSALAGWGPGRAGGLCCSGALSSMVFLNASMRQYLTFWIPWNLVGFFSWHWFAVLQRSLLKTPLPPSKQKIPGTCLRNSNNLHVSNVWFCTKLHTGTFREKKQTSFAPLSKAVKSQTTALKYEFGISRLQKGCGCGGALLDCAWKLLDVRF